MIGQVLGNRYRLQERIGSGGMAEVYRGLDPVLNRTVAIKILLAQFARDTGFVQRFRREAQAAARLNHPGIVGVYDSGSDENTQWIVMEFVEGRTLADFLASGRKPIPMQAVDIAGRIADALSAAHAQGVIHRDVKPGNVMVTRDGVVKVMDFGIARVLGSEATAPQTSAVMGTASYLSPEQAQGGPVDSRSDIYSLGTVLYELLTGRPPFTGESPVAVAWKQVNENPVPPSTVNPEVSAVLDAVVMKALSKNPANRYQTADEFSRDLAHVRQGEPVLATPILSESTAAEATQVISRPQHTQVLPPQMEPRGSGRKVWLGVLIGVLVVAILGGGGYLIAQSLTDKNQPALVGVPDLTGKTRAEADAALRLVGLKLVLPVQTQEDDQAQPNTVIGQDPAPQTQVASGSAVSITIAKPKQVLVPDLTGKTPADAASILQGFGLTLGTSTQTAPSDTIPAGSIVTQDPPANSSVKVGSPVDVVLSSGPGTVVLPDVTCISFAAASSQLSGLGLKPVFAGTAPMLAQCPKPARVAAMDPAAGSTVQAGGTVNLFTGEPASSPPSTPPPTP